MLYGKIKQRVRDDVTEIIKLYFPRDEDLNYTGFAGPDFGIHKNFTEFNLLKEYKKSKIVLVEEDKKVYNKVLKRLKKFDNLLLENKKLDTYLNELSHAKKQINACWFDGYGPISRKVFKYLYKLFNKELLETNGVLFITICEQARFKGRRKCLASKFKTTEDFLNWTIKNATRNKFKLELIYKKPYKNSDVDSSATPMGIYGFKILNNSKIKSNVIQFPTFKQLNLKAA